MSYSAKTAYFDGDSLISYKKKRFSSFYGKYLLNKEIRNVKKVINLLDYNSSIADIPCGPGRWWNILLKKAEQLTACDISPGMIKYAKIQKKKYKNKKIKILKADAEKLNFPNNFFDYTFCFALTKHLPTKIQFKVLNELSRVSKKGFICTLPVGNFFSRIIYNFRGKKLKAELKLIKKSKLNRFINDNNLTVVFKKKLTSFLGVEYIFYFKKI